jgi:excisionase family DNA binding protein
MPTKVKYDITSAKAAQLLGVSQKTVIRWAQAGKLGFTDVRGSKSGKYRFSGNDVTKLCKKIGRTTSVQTVNLDFTEEKLPANVNKIEDKVENKIFKKLFEETKHELQEKQNKLEGANYRVGQLETQLKNSVPLLEFSKKVSEKEDEREGLRGNVRTLEKRLEVERRMNWIFLSLLVIFLVEIVVFFALR